MRNLIFAQLLLLISSTAYGQDKVPPGSAEHGYQVYMKVMCYTCHGTVGQGAERGTGPKLAPNPISYENFERQLRTPRQDMPAYRKQFVSDQDVADIYVYLMSIKPSPAAKDVPLLDFGLSPEK